MYSVTDISNYLASADQVKLLVTICYKMKLLKSITINLTHTAKCKFYVIATYTINAVAKPMIRNCYPGDVGSARTNAS